MSRLHAQDRERALFEVFFVSCVCYVKLWPFLPGCPEGLRMGGGPAAA